MEMWLITLGFALSLVICVVVYSVKHKDTFRLLLNIFKKAPWNFIPLIISMYLLIEGLAKTNLITDLGIILSNLHPIVSYGTSSFIFANIMNNIPMSMFFSKIIATSLIGTSATMATYASIIGANLGVLLTPFGALAGLMWFQLLKQHDIHLNFKIYLKYMFIVSISVLALSLFTLYLVFGI